MSRERDTLCPWCGAADPAHCDFREDMNGTCPWEESDDDEDDAFQPPVPK